MINPVGTTISTRYNFQKIYLNSSSTVSLANTVTPTEYTLVTHSLGYIPTVRIFYEPVAGQLWPMSPNQYANIDGGPGTTLSVYGSPVVTDSEIKVRVVNASGGIKDVVFYWRIYLDE